MKTTFKFFVMVAVAASFAACAVKKNEKAPISKNGQVQDKAKTTDVPTAACVGGQPGVIDIQGALTQGEDGKPMADARLSFNQQAGLSADSKRAETNLRAVLHPVSVGANLADVAIDKDRTFINLGCDSLGDAAKDMTEKKLADAKDVASSKANRIFICGQQTLPAGMVSLKADAIFLNNATVTMAANYPSTLSIQANTIGVSGQNTIKIAAIADKAGAVVTPASVNMVIVKGMQGEKGLLEISSAGSNCVSEGNSKDDAKNELNEFGEDLTK